MQCTISFLRDSCLSGDDGKRCKLVKMVSSEEEVRWLAEIAKGQKAYMKRLVEKWQNPLFRFFFRSLSNHADSEDLTQNFFACIQGVLGTNPTPNFLHGSSRSPETC